MEQDKTLESVIGPPNLKDAEDILTFVDDWEVVKLVKSKKNNPKDNKYLFINPNKRVCMVVEKTETKYIIIFKKVYDTKRVLIVDRKLPLTKVDFTVVGRWFRGETND